MAIVWLWAAAYVGAVSLSWNSAAYPFVADVIASCAWISDNGIPRGNRFWRDRGCDSLVRRANVVSASCDANGVVHLRGCSRFHGAVFHRHHGIRRNLESLDRCLGSRIVGTRNGLVACRSLRLAPYQRAGCFRTTFTE